MPEKFKSRIKPSCHPERPYEALGLCKNCYQNDRYRNNPKVKRRISELNKKYYANDRDKFIDKQLKNKYGISLKQYNRIFAKQKGCCAVCNIHQSELKDSLCVDYNHETGIIRGLLCGKCNRGLGNFNDNADILKQAIKYVKRDKDARKI